MSISTQSQLPSLSPDRISFLRSLLKLSPEERNALLAEHCVILSQESTSESDEMEWAEEYIENELDYSNTAFFSKWLDQSLSG